VAKNSKVDPIKSTEKIQNNVEELAKSLEHLQKTLSPLMDFGSIKKEVDGLKDIVPSGQNVGETTEERMIDSIFDLCVAYPNDTELGGKVRELYNYFHNTGDDTEE
jgi:hypothetical protein